VAGDEVTVRLVRHVRYVFGRGLPGGAADREVTAVAHATVRRR
jgi:hypothetical protein